MKIVADKNIPFVADYFADHGDLVLIPGRELKTSDVKDADMLLVRSITPVNASLLQDSNVKFVGSVTSGVDHIDTKWLASKNIHFASAKGFNAQPVADYVVSVIAAAQRRQALSTQRKKAAVIGVGEVGSRVVAHLHALGFDVLQCDPLREENEADFSSVHLDAISEVDVICVHTPLTLDGPYPTFHMIDEAFLDRQHEGCLLINASRGAVVKTDALKTNGRHVFWCMDVWENEPRIDNDIVRGSLFATPHIAGYSVQARQRGVADIFAKAREFGLVADEAKHEIDMPVQILSFSGKHQHWQDIVMGVFNPLVMTAMMREAFLVPEPDCKQFDAMRLGFNYRHELAHTIVESEELLVEDADMLEKLGIKLN